MSSACGRRPRDGRNTLRRMVQRSHAKWIWAHSRMCSDDGATRHIDVVVNERASERAAGGTAWTHEQWPRSCFVVGAVCPPDGLRASESRRHVRQHQSAVAALAFHLTASPPRPSRPVYSGPPAKRTARGAAVAAEHPSGVHPRRHWPSRCHARACPRAVRDEGRGGQAKRLSAYRVVSCGAHGPESYGVCGSSPADGKWIRRKDL